MKKRFDYALALIDHLKEQGQEFVGIRKAARDCGLPRPYLEKVAQELRAAGWLESRKGSAGGYRLLKNPKSLSVKALMRFYSPIQSFCPLLRIRNRKK